MATTLRAAASIRLRNILLLTDFSEASGKSVPFARAMARWHGATVHALHVLTPDPLVAAAPETASMAFAAKSELAFSSMRQTETQLAGVEYQCLVEQSLNVWDGVDQAIRDYSIDLIVLGSHGRTGAQRFLLGSTGEEIFRRAPVPVLTVGPAARFCSENRDGFRRILFATDFTPSSMAAAPLAAMLAASDGARMMLLHVLPMAGPHNGGEGNKVSVAETIHQLSSVMPPEIQLPVAPEALIEFGKPVERIVEVARYRLADAIVLGVHSARGHLGTATHLERAMAHEVVVQAPCPVVTVSGENYAVPNRAMAI